MDRRESTSTSLKQNQEEDEEFIPISRPSLSKSSSLMQEKLPKVNKKNRVPKKPLSPKSKGKQAVSTKSTKSESSKRKRTQVNDIYDCDEDRYSVRERAGKLLLSLDANLASLPGFGKCMLPSNVTYSFWMILPTKFCNAHLPQCDTTITLVDERGEEFKTTFLMDRHGLSAGWRGFSIGHRLIKGDILLFHLVEPCKFKVHIVRVHSLDLVEAALCLMDMEADRRATASGKGKKHKKAKKETKVNKKRKRYLGAGPMDACSSQAELVDGGVSTFDPSYSAELYESSSDGLCSKLLEGSEITNHLKSSELSGSGSSCHRDHLQEGIGHRSAVRMYDSSSTVAT